MRKLMTRTGPIDPEDDILVPTWRPVTVEDFDWVTSDLKMFGKDAPTPTNTPEPAPVGADSSGNSQKRRRQVQDSNLGVEFQGSNTIAKGID